MGSTNDAARKGVAGGIGVVTEDARRAVAEVEDDFDRADREQTLAWGGGRVAFVIPKQLDVLGQRRLWDGVEEHNAPDSTLFFESPRLRDRRERVDSSTCCIADIEQIFDQLMHYRRYENAKRRPCRGFAGYKVSEDLGATSIITEVSKRLRTSGLTN